MHIEKKKVLFDTDIGSDIDDAVALAYLLQQSMCEIVGITTVSGDAVKRAQLASVLCRAAGKGDIPIYPGTRMPLLDKEMQPHVPQAEVLDLYEHTKEFPMNRHIQFMIDTIRANPGEISLLAVGPMTNIGLLFAVDPEIPGLLKELVLMCGVFTYRTPQNGPREWNALCDPHSTGIVYNARPVVHRSIGLDVTRQVTMTSEEVTEKFNTDLLKIVLSMAKFWFDQRPILTFHDPLAAVTLFDDSICSFERGKVDVELVSQYLRGMTLFKEDKKSGPHEVALKVDREKFFSHYFSVFEK